MTITKTEFLADRVKIHYFCRRPWGDTDQSAVVDVLYASIPTLPRLPQDYPHGVFRAAWEESIFIPAANATILFRFEKWQETDDCRMEALVGEPYLAVCVMPPPAAGPPVRLLQQ